LEEGVLRVMYFARNCNCRVIRNSMYRVLLFTDSWARILSEGFKWRFLALLVGIFGIVVRLLMLVGKVPLLHSSSVYIEIRVMEGTRSFLKRRGKSQRDRLAGINHI